MATVTEQSGRVDKTPRTADPRVVAATQWHLAPHVNWEEEDPRLLQAEVVEAIACAAASSAHEFLIWLGVLGITFWSGQPTLSERAADAVDEIERELTR